MFAQATRRFFPQFFFKHDRRPRFFPWLSFFFLWQIWPDRPVLYAKLNSTLLLLPFLFFFRTTLTGSNESNDGGKCAECHKVQELLSFLWLKGFSTFPSDLFRSARTSSWAFDPSVRPPVHNNFSLSNGESPWYLPPFLLKKFPAPNISLLFLRRLFFSSANNIFFPSPDIFLLYLFRFSYPPQNTPFLSPFFFSFTEKNIYSLFKYFPRFPSSSFFRDIEKVLPYISCYTVPHQ